MRNFIQSVRDTFTIMSRGSPIERENAIINLRNTDVYIYKECSINGFELGDCGVYLSISLTPLFKLSLSALRNMKRLMTGSLLLIASQDFKKALFVTVFKKSNDEEALMSRYLNDGVIDVDVKVIDTEESNENFKTIFQLMDMKRRNIFVFEAQSYFEAYVHTLTNLQTLKPEHIPFKDYIIKAFPNVDKPCYLSSSTMYKLNFNLKEITATENMDNDIKTYPIMNPQKWPDHNEYMDESQLEALINMLTKEVSIVQGPPG